MYYEIGKNILSPISAINALTGRDIVTEEMLIEAINKTPETKRQAKLRTVHNDVNIVVEGLTNPSVKLAHCCAPVLGDDIVGFVTKGTGIAVHRRSCKNVQKYEPERLLDVFWGDNTLRKYETTIKITVMNRDNILAEIINTATANKGKINQVSAQVNRSKEGIIKLKIEVGNLMELDTIINSIQRIRDIYRSKGCADMRVVVQRVSSASVSVDKTVRGTIGPGLVLLVGIARHDTVAEMIKAAKKVAMLRIFADAEGKLNRNVIETGGQILSVSQFTLLGDVSGGNRPSFTAAMAGPEAEPLFDAFNFQLAREFGLTVATGVFGAHMELSLCNDGPVTIVIEIGPD